jgi:hypothetical protein
MLTDGIKSQNLEEQIKQVDVAELLERACAVADKPASASPTAAPPDVLVPAAEVGA